MSGSDQSLGHVLVTGAGGYSGTILVTRLLRQGYRVTALDRYFFGETLLPNHPALTRLKEDTRCIQASLFEDVDAVVDLAALSNDPLGEHFTEATWAINHAARARTARLAREAGVPHYLLPSSCSVYGFGRRLPDEQSPTRRLTHYARANLAAERDILPLAGPGFCVTVLRQGTVFGRSPRMRFDLAINAMIHSAWKQGVIHLNRDGNQYRPFLHVADAAGAIVHMLSIDAASINGRIFNVGADHDNFCMVDLARKLQTELGRRLQREITVRWCGSPDRRSYRVKFARITEGTGWRPGQRLEDGLEEMIAGLRHGEIQRTPRTLTLEWYRRLERETPAELMLHGGILHLAREQAC